VRRATVLYRKEIAARLVSATTGAAHDGRSPGRTVVQRGADVAMRPFGALLAVPGRGVEVVHRKQESALAGDSQRPDGTTTGSGAAGSGHDDHDSPLPRWLERDVADAARQLLTAPPARPGTPSPQQPANERHGAFNDVAHKR
jgi:hypothetical protein